MKKLILFLLVIQAWQCTAQDLHFSHFMQAPLQRGAGEAGNFNGDLRITALQRKQWASVTTPYRSLGLSADGKLSGFSPALKGLNSGIVVNYDRAGDGELTALQLLLAVSYRIPLTADSVHFLRAGISGGIVQHSIDFNALTFDNQFNGDLFDPQALSGENFGDDNFITGDWGFSLGWTGYGSKTMLDAGFQVMHINRAQWTLLDQGNADYPLLYQATLNGDIPTTDRISWKPALTWMQQDQNREITGGTELQFRIRELPVRAWAFSFAAFYRYRDAVIPQVALYYDKFRFGFSYDVNISGLKEVSHYRGGAEFSLVYIASKIRIPKNTSVCPVY